MSGGDYSWYNWDIGWNVINEEHSNGTLSMTYTMNSPAAQVAGILADASTTNPATGTYRYYTHDNLGSTRRLRASDKSSLGAYEYTPYGQAYATSGVALGSLAGAFTGKAWDDTSQLYYFPYRYYSPDGARWLTRDPAGTLDGPNVYNFVSRNPCSFRDRLGLLGELSVDDRDIVCRARLSLCLERVGLKARKAHTDTTVFALTVFFGCVLLGGAIGCANPAIGATVGVACVVVDVAIFGISNYFASKAKRCDGKLCYLHYYICT